VVLEKETEQHSWQRTASGARPKDGQKAEVLDGRNPKFMIFRAAPIARWESLDGKYVYEFTFFAQWRPL
jgi:hypothetical protein